ncbi:MAG TPA: recombinase family protein [Methylobacter sp.]|jgi:DNA invertase Pin-like site-specific DNA recombinase
MPTAYSYVRFSTPEQIKGDSIRRQVELSSNYAEDHNLTLDDSLQLNDLGVSAFKGDNASTGKLGLFIAAIDTGRVEPGSYLLIESLDRLSRAEVITALNLFTQILSKDITIVTLTDNRVYTKESINDFGNLMYSLLVMSRAHEESLMKSKRVSAAWENKRKQARDGTHKLTKTCPSWLELKDGEFRPISERVELVKRMYDMAQNGYGYVTIAKTLNLENQPTFDAFGKKANGWHQSYVVRILKNPSVYGQFTPHLRIEGKRVPQEPIEDYYPSIISQDDFFAVQAAISSRRGKGGQVGSQVNILANILKCGKCGGSAVRINKSGKQASVDKHYKWVAVVCDAGRRGVTDCGWLPWKLDELEKAVLEEITELDLDLVLDNETNDKSLVILKRNIQSLAEQIVTIQKQKERLVDALAGGDTGLTAITDRIKSLSRQEDDLIATMDILTQEYDVESHRLSSMTRSQDEIKRLTYQLDDNDVRLKLQTEVRRLVDKIVLHMKIKKCVIHYHTPKLVVRFKDGRSVSFIESEGDLMDDPV